MQNKAFLKGTVILLSLITFSVAQAHDRAAEGSAWMAGLSHPLLGWDHLLVMLAVGLWSAQQRGRIVWYLPAVFVSVMAIGAGIGGTGLPLPGIESGIAVSLLVLGLLLAFAIRLPMILSIVMVGLFALSHGWSHGTQMPPATSIAIQGAGLILTTALMHVVGVRLGQFCSGATSTKLLRFGGGAIAITSVLAWV